MDYHHDKKSPAGYKCFRCKDMGFVVRDVPVNHPDFGKAFRCVCGEKDDAARRSAYLLRIDGLTPDERKRRFDQLQRNDNQVAIDIVARATQLRRGMIVLTGAPGVGKTTLLVCAVNAARDAGVPAVYTTVATLLDYLRDAYAPNRELTHDARWELLVRCEVLALDELDDFSPTPWAAERFVRLMDERWRNVSDMLTLMAMNGSAAHLPDKVRSRLSDGRTTKLQLVGEDMRGYLRWDGDGTVVERDTANDETTPTASGAPNGHETYPLRLGVEAPTMPHEDAETGAKGAAQTVQSVVNGLVHVFKTGGGR